MKNLPNLYAVQHEVHHFLFNHLNPRSREALQKLIFMNFKVLDYRKSNIRDTTPCSLLVH